MKVLVTGADGYIGSLLAPLLREQGYEVTGFDAGFFQEARLYETPGAPPLAVRNLDTRHVVAEDVRGFDAVVHLAELSNDPLGQLNPDVTYEINHRGTVDLAKTCKKAGVSRFVYTSSCSVYGIATHGDKTEASETNPQTTYSECKVLAERDLAKLADHDFSPILLRNATAYGPSPRMRFDLVLNNLCGLAWTTGRIGMTSDGTPWRPLVHVLDICGAIACCLEARKEAVHNQIFNVGDNRENYRVKEIADIVARVFPGCETTYGPSQGDVRSYRVSFDKINTQLPEFRCRRTALDGATELRELFKRVNLTRDTFDLKGFTRLRQLQYLLETGQINERLFWK